MRIFIIRHAESYSNTQGKMVSAADFPLTDKGIKQTNAAKVYIDSIIHPKYFSHIFSSPLLRAKQTAGIFNIRPLSKLHSGSLHNRKFARKYTESEFRKRSIEIVESELLKEMDLGILEGLTWDERAARFPHIDMEKSLSDICFPKGESFEDIKIRCAAFIGTNLALEDDALVLIVTHGITSRVLINCLADKQDNCVNYLNWPDNTSFTEIDYDADANTGRIVRLNDRRHLTEHNLGAEGYEKWGLFSQAEYI